MLRAAGQTQLCTKKVQARASIGETRKCTREPVEVSGGATRSQECALVREAGASVMVASLGQGLRQM